MACKKYYFYHDYYGVGFNEEEVTTEVVQGNAAAGSASDNKEVAGILEELGHLNAVIDHNYNREEKISNDEPEQAGKEPVFRKPIRYCRKQFKFTPEQVLELDRVFEETQYPDALKRKELAELINVEEYTVKIWFNNRRAKLRKDERALIRRNILTGQLSHFPLKILKETNSVIVLQQPLGDRFFHYEPHEGHPNWQ
ncbi:rhox homeobox family member 1-like [Sigmodon hispidus]